MILKSLQRSISLLSSARHSFGVLLLDDKNFQMDYDVIISDISKDDLSGEISIRLGKKNLTPLLSDEREFQNIRNGTVYGRNGRAIISLPTRFKNKQPIWIHYLVDSGSPWSFLSTESLTSLIGSKTILQGDMFALKVNGLFVNMGVSRAHFQDINLLGMDYLRFGRYIIDAQNEVVSIQFHEKQ